MTTQRGAILLRRYLAKQGISLYAFAETHGFCRIQLSRLLKGERKRVSVDTALAIQTATAGAVPMQSWARSTVAAEVTQ